ncbi:MAG: DUF4355 domain-containing protein [Ruminococcus sp.]|nr:DUF4355 domain-containing protein [Ruminococcus sp.]MBQ1310170.1 DUF4355 domain-containing protein [Ruminococcus sp.]
MPTKTDTQHQSLDQDANANVETAEIEATENAPATGNEEARKFTQEDMDRVVKKRLQAAEAKHQQAVDAAVKKAIADYDRKAKMTEADRAAEASKEREAELARREQELAVRENRNRAVEELTKKNIPTSLVDYIATADADETDENIAAFEADWSKALAAAIKDAARGSAPRDARSEEDRNGAGAKKYTGTQVL